MYNPKVAVIDSGVDKTNKSLLKHIINGYALDIEENKIIESADYEDTYGHGTNCIDYILQIASMAQFYPIKIINKEGKTTSRLLIEALRKCIDLPLDIICVSLSITSAIDKDVEKGLQDICSELAGQGKIICVSESNNIKNSIPAIYDSVIGVSGIEDNAENRIIVNKKAPIQVMADISPVFVAGKPGQYNFFKGTSKGNAFIAGILSELLQRGKCLNNLEQALNELQNVYIEPEVIEKESLGKIQSDELGIVILKQIQEVLIRFGCEYTMEEVSKYPFISKITGVNFFNFFDFITNLYDMLGIKESDYHCIKIGDVCTLYNLIEYLKGKMCYEKDQYGVRANKKI